MTPEDDSIPTPEPIAVVSRGRTGKWLVHSRGVFLLSYNNPRSAKALARYINELNEHIVLHPESAEQLLASGDPNVPADT